MAAKRYEESGVSVKAGEELVSRVKAVAGSTFSDGVIGGLGGFAAFFALDRERYEEPVLVSAADGVGTKLKIATLCSKFDTVGIDLVAMCVNDILTSGAKPLFFLDYVGTGKLVVEQAEMLIKGVAEGCREAGCSLVGGETAELPGTYPGGEFDLVGFAVGVVERKRIIDGSRIEPGDVIFGIPSSGIHSNGYSLVRKVLLEEKGFRVDDEVDVLGCKLGEELLRPTRIYSKDVSKFDGLDIHGMAHITGGGWYGNIPRVLPEKCRAIMQKGSWKVPPIFGFLQSEGEIGENEMFSCFNMGIGFVVFVGGDDKNRLAELGACEIGEVREGKKGLEII